KDSVTGLPISGATVTASGGATGTATTSATGAYSLNVTYGGGSSGTVNLVASAPGYTTSAPQTTTCTGNGNGTCSPAIVNFALVSSATADLSITKDDGTSTVTAGEGTTRTYTIKVSNAGPASAAAATFTDTWPTGFTRGTLPAGCSNVGAGPNFTCTLG